jgi:hypothetical protein
LRADLARRAAASAGEAAATRDALLSLLADGGLRHRGGALLELGIESAEDARDPVRDTNRGFVLFTCVRFRTRTRTIQTQMAQKPLLREEVYARALRASQTRRVARESNAKKRAEVWVGAQCA